MPWIAFLFLGLFDVGLYMNALINTENAARVAALQASQGGGSNTAACTIALSEMAALSNISGLTTCGTSGTVSTSMPLSVVYSSASDSSNGTYAQVVVTYLSIPIVTIPGVFPSQMTITQSAKAPISNS